MQMGLNMDKIEMISQHLIQFPESITLQLHRYISTPDEKTNIQRVDNLDPVYDPVPERSHGDEDQRMTR